jgi:hypothetical protein
VGASRQASLFDQTAGQQYKPVKSGVLGGAFDGRLKPEIFAPGCRLRTAEAGTSCSVERATLPSGLSCGTSWATAAVSGAAALVRQYFDEGRHPSGAAFSSLPPFGSSCRPTGALVKAVLLNGTRDMKETPSVEANEYPSAAEGWGLLRLDDSLYLAGAGDKLKTLVVDIENGTGVGLKQDEAVTYEVSVPSPTWDGRDPLLAADTRLKVTLVWTDPCVVNGTDPKVNDLDLIVREQNRSTYCGNRFYRHETDPGKVGQSAPDPSASCGDAYADRLNNVEQVVLYPGPGPHTYQVTVKGIKIDAAARQGFALVVSGELAGQERLVGPGCTSLSEL